MPNESALALRNALHKGDALEFKRLMGTCEKNISADLINAAGPDTGKTALHRALDFLGRNKNTGDYPAARFVICVLIGLGGDLDKSDKGGLTPRQLLSTHCLQDEVDFITNEKCMKLFVKDFLGLNGISSNEQLKSMFAKRDELIFLSYSMLRIRPISEGGDPSNRNSDVVARELQCFSLFRALLPPTAQAEILAEEEKLGAELAELARRGVQ